MTLDPSPLNTLEGGIVIRLLFEQPQMCKISDVNEDECASESVSVGGVPK